MVFGHFVSSPRGSLSLQQTLNLANIYLENAKSVQDPDIALVLCHDAEVSLTQARKGARHAEDPITSDSIATAYISLGRVLNSRGHTNEAMASYKKAEKWGKVPGPESSAEIPDPKSIAPSIKSTVDSVVDTLSVKDRPYPPRTNKTPNDIATIPTHIFADNVRPPTIAAKLPEPDERLLNTPQLAYCLGLLNDSHELDDILEPATRKWLQVVENDEDEHERLKVLSQDVIRTFKKEEIKDAKAVAEVICLAPVLEMSNFRELLKSFYDGIDHSGLLDIHQLQGLSQLIQGADTGYLEADDLVKILGLLTTRLKETHQQSPQHIYQLTLAASNVLDAMADTKVEGLDRETLHEPLSSYMDALKGNSEPYLMYQAAYACQALLCVPDNESLWQATVRRTGKVIRGVSGLVTAVKGLDLSGFIDGLKDIQQGIAGASEAMQLIVTAFDGAKSMTEDGQGFLEGIKEGLSFKRKCAWYSALRGADTLIQDGEFATFKQLVCEAPCRLDPAFQWGVCQRLGEVASNPAWDARTRRSAAAFLGEIYRNDGDWGNQTSVKEWIITILMQLSSSVGSIQQYVETLLQELETNSNVKDKERFQACREKDARSYPLKLALPPLGSPSLLDRVQNKPDVEGTLRQLRKQRLKERINGVYIPSQAKASVQASDDDRFFLMEKVQEFLEGDQKVFLLLGDSGAGKSIFNVQLERELWQDYKKTTGRIPLFISLPAIDKPEQDMIGKHLRRSEFTEPEIRELKEYRKFILICDGYDESQQMHNLYMSNKLNQEGEWNAQMVISCRSEYLGVDYRDRFQPGDRNRPEPGQLQEAVIAPFTSDQVHDYINQYVLKNQVLWEAKEYEEALDAIPSLKELVRNPFLMTLSLEVLPRMVDPREHLSATQVTRVALYDQFIEHWLERGKKRLGEKELSPQAKAAYESLVDEGFTQNGVNFLKKLAVAIYKEQGGQPIVKYSRFKDEGTWKTAFFSREEEKQLLREAIPLTRSGNQHRFIHRSLLEYGLALAIYDPNDWKESSIPEPVSGRRGSTSSAYSFNVDSTTEEVSPVDQVPDINSPLAWRYFINEPSLLQFLCERVHQEPEFRKQLFNYIEYSKTDEKWRRAAANAITILVRSGEKFNGADLNNIRIPGADLSYGMFDSASLQDADLRKVTLRSAWLREADLSRAQMSGVQIGEFPFIKEDSEVYSCVYSPDGNSLAVSLGSGDIKVYSTSNWELTRILRGHSDFIRRIAFSPNGERLVSGSKDSTVRLWNVEAESCIRTLTGHDGEVNCVAYSPRGDTIASGDDGIVRVWDVETGGCQLIFTGHTSLVSNIAYSPHGRQIASASCDDTVRLWCIETETCLHTLSGHVYVAFGVWGLAFSPQGDRLAASSGGKSVWLWDVETGTCCRIINDADGYVDTLSYSPQGDVIVSAGNDKTVRLWDLESGTCRLVLTGHSGPVSCVAFSPNGDRIASASYDKTVRLWDVGLGGALQVPTGPSDSVEGVKHSPQGDQVVSNGGEGTIKLWNVETGVCHRNLVGHTDRVKCVAFSPQGDTIVSASMDKTVRIWDVATGTCGQTFTGHDSHVEAVAYSPRGDQVASGDWSSMVKLWDVETGECSHILIGHTREVMSIVYSPKGNQIVSTSYNETVCLWDTKSGDCLRTVSDTYADFKTIAYSPLGDLFVSASQVQSLKLFDAESWDCRHILVGHIDPVYFVAFSPSGDLVASGCSEGIVNVWNVETGSRIQALTGHTKYIASLVFSPNSQELVSGSGDNTVRLWDVVSGHCRAVIQDLNHSIGGIDWSPASNNTDCFVIGCWDGSMRRWRVTGEGDQRRVHLCWSSAVGSFSVRGALVQDVRGLSQLNKQLLKQRGAVGEPFVPLREAGKKLIGMTSVVSALKNMSCETVQDPPLPLDPPLGSLDNMRSSV